MTENQNNGEPIILGELKKQKTSKPFFVMITFLVIIGVCFFLPAIQTYLKQTGSPLANIYDYFFGSEEPEEEAHLTKDTIVTLTKDVVINYDLLELYQLVLSDNTVSYTLKSKAEPINLDEDTLYLEIYSTGNKLLHRVKLTGMVTPPEVKQAIIFKSIKFNANINYLGRIYRMTDADYEAVTFASPIAELKCTNAAHTYTYTFNQSQLKIINHTYVFNDTHDLDLYLETLDFYTTLSKTINGFTGSNATALETNAGLEFKAKLDLTNITAANLKSIKDNNYYALDSAAKIVKYEMKAKGYECQ